MSSEPHKRITIDPPDTSTIFAARHLDASEGCVHVGSVVDASTRSAINRVLDYVSKAHNSLAEPTEQLRADVHAPEGDEPRPWPDLRTSGLLWLINRVVFHPRGIALALHEQHGKALGWSLVTAAEGEPFSFLEPVDNDGFSRAEATLRTVRQEPTPVNSQTPSVGRIVHYVSFGTPVREDGTQAFPAKCRAAIVTDVYSEDNPHPDPELVVGVDGAEWVALAVLNPTEMFFNDCCHDETTKLGGTWHWPERV